MRMGWLGHQGGETGTAGFSVTTRPLFCKLLYSKTLRSHKCRKIQISAMQLIDSKWLRRRPTRCAFKIVSCKHLSLLWHCALCRISSNVPNFLQSFIEGSKRTLHIGRLLQRKQLSKNRVRGLTLCSVTTHQMQNLAQLCCSRYTALRSNCTCSWWALEQFAGFVGRD